MKAPYETSGDRGVALDLLRGEALTHTVTLKMLCLYPSACRTTTFLRGNVWSCLTEMDAAASHWDRKEYPRHHVVVFLDGNADELLELAFERAPKTGSVFKVHASIAMSLVQALPGVECTRAFHTYTTPAGYTAPPCEAPVVESSTLTREAVRLFGENGYAAEELSEHFEHGATWFGLLEGGRCVSACFVFPNYQSIWEVAGVHTAPEHRRKGYARSVVQAALRRLLATGRVPRYQFRDDNTASRAVAECLGMRRVLTMYHYATAIGPP